MPHSDQNGRRPCAHCAVNGDNAAVRVNAASAVSSAAISRRVALLGRIWAVSLVDARAKAAPVLVLPTG